MPSYNRKCCECGDPITLTNHTTHGGWVALDPVTGGTHQCRRSGPINRTYSYLSRDSVETLDSSSRVALHAPLRHSLSVGEGWVRKVRPSDDDQYSNDVEVVMHDGIVNLQIAYWRISIRPNQAVHLVQARGKPRGVLAFYGQDDFDRGKTLLEPRIYDDTSHLVDQPQVRGRIAAIEELPGIVVRNFSPDDFESEVFTSESRLCWFVDAAKYLVPILVKKCYGNDRVGCERTVVGRWVELCGTHYLVALNLFGPAQ